MWSVLTAPCLVATVVPSINGKQVALHPLAADIGAAHPAGAFAAAADLVDLVEKDDAVLLDGGDRLAHDHVLVEELVALLGHQHAVAVADRHFFRLGAGAERLAENVAEIEHAHLRAGHAGDLESRQVGRRTLLHRDFDLAVVERALAKLLAEFLTRVGAGIGADQRVEHPLLGGDLGLGLDLLAQPLAGHPDRDLDEVAHDLLDIAADIADLGELRRLDLDKGRLREPGQPPRDLGLAAAGRADHQDVLGQHLLAQFGCQLLAPPAVAQRDRDGALGVMLADDKTVELGNDLARAEGGHRRVSSPFSRG